MTSDIFTHLFQAMVGTSAGILAVLLLRRHVRAAFGARTAYALWLIVPIALIASLLPAELIFTQTMKPTVTDKPAITSMRETQPIAQAMPTPQQHTIRAATPHNTETPTDLSPWLFGLWFMGVAASLTILGLRQKRFYKQHGLTSSKARVARHAKVGPAVFGFLTPRIVVPDNFTAAYNALERRLILAHEQAHIRAGDMQMNALAIALRSLNWFNPLAYVAYGLFRTDQELACDERVMRRFGQHRRAYAETLLKSQLMGDQAPLGCAWFGNGRHPLTDRVKRLARQELSLVRRALGMLTLIGATSLSGVAAWAALSSQVVYIADNSAATDADAPVAPLERVVAANSNTTALQDAQGAALVDAILEGRTRHAEALLGAGVNVDYDAPGDGTPLLVAALKGDFSMVKTLLDAGADVNKVSPGSGTPLLVAARSGNESMVKTLLEAGADINKAAPGDGTPLLVAARRGDKSMVQALLQAGADVNGFSPGDGTPLLVAARRGNTTMVKALLEAGADINQVAPGDGTPLLVAVRAGETATTELLLEAGADINGIAPGDGTPLIVAAQRGDDVMVKALLNVGADVNGYAPGDGTPLVVAARGGNQKMVSLLLDAGADVNLAAPGDGNPLIMASVVGNLPVVEQLVSVGADVNGFVLGDETPLIGAARAGHLDVAEFLIAKGADVNLRVKAGNVWNGRVAGRAIHRSPLGQALRYGHDDMAALLRKHGATEPVEEEE
ncbi:M56 family metallopeptidase [Kordiimonas sp.]|uniref:M56 family metallopeptidase n=1 Tax=Kordiimonas sp. TaxID=1970157 RepID=UPI003A900331